MKSKSLNPRFLKSSLAIAALSLCTNAWAQWTTVDTAGFQPFGNLYEHLFFDAANTPYVSFSGLHGEVMKFNGTTWDFVGGADITPGQAGESWSAIAPDGTIYFSYVDGNDSMKPKVMMYDGSSWSAVGGSLSSDTSFTTNIAVSSTGVPYVSFIDRGSVPAWLSVKRYIAGSWATVGGAPVDTGINFPSLAIDSHDSVYIAYDDAGGEGKVIVRKFNGIGWIMIDTPFSAVSTGENAYVSLALDHNDVPYVSYLNGYPAGNSVSVSKFDGAHFVTVGAASFTPLNSAFASMAIDHNNLPYVVYSENMLGSLTSVMKYDGASWGNLGSAGFSPSSAVFNTIAIDGNNNPFVSFLDGANGGTTVMKYPVCTPSSVAVITASDSLICKGSSDTLTAAGTLNDAANWYWYTGSCSGTLIDSGATITILPGDTTTYYVHGGGGCVLSALCSHVTVNVDSIATPVISVSGLVLTSTAAAGYQWYLGDTPIPAATVQTDTAFTPGWYKVMVTNANGCSSMSDSVFIAIPENTLAVQHILHASVYPSPAADFINVDFTGIRNAPDDCRITIIDNVGRTVFTQDHASIKNNISLHTMPSGVYFISITAPGMHQVEKIIKQ